MVAEQRLAVPEVTRAIVRRAGPSIELSSAPGPGAEDQRLRVIPRPSSCQQLPERRAFDELHHDEELLVQLADVVNGDDSGMIQ